MKYLFLILTEDVGILNFFLFKFNYERFLKILNFSMEMIFEYMSVFETANIFYS